MKKLNSSSYQSIIQKIEKIPCGTVYPFSIAEMNQYGEVYKDGDSILIWHYCGFAFLYGVCDNVFLETIYNKFLSSFSNLSRRFILLSANPRVIEFFQNRHDIVFGQRYNFEYLSDNPLISSEIRPEYQVYQFNKELFDNTPGRITPRFSWRDASEFLNHGIGYCVLYNERAVSWAFSAAVSSDEIDIGIETVSDFRHMGLGLAVAEKMIKFCFEHHKRPVWSCDANNIASQKIAKKLGFIKCSEYTTIRR
ncbi:MAG: GNAT family N-acetyltransferase [Lachnospiraceae bacterium]|nr:GNAT family N-acetyltransferase [Lachnospiraceae bacterium]